MPILVAVFYNLTAPYLDSLRKNIAERSVSSLTILHAPNIVGHPIGVGILLAIGLFSVPTDLTFFLWWFCVVAASALSLVWMMRGLLETHFFAVQVLIRSNFLSSSLAAMVILGERVTAVGIVSFALAALGICLFAWPHRAADTKIVWDRGVIFVILSLILFGLSVVFYKIAAIHAPDYTTFLTGRLLGDLIFWSVIWIIGVSTIGKKNPFEDLKRCISDREGLPMIAGIIASTLAASWLIYVLPVTTFAMLGTLAIPGAYFWSRIRYREHVTLRMWIGTGCIVIAIFLFFI